MGLLPVDVGAVIDDVIELYEAVAEERDVTLSWVDRMPVFVLGDKALLQRMAANILDNAIKFSPSGGTVSIKLQATGEQFNFSMRDLGVGIATEFGSSAFNRFSRGPGTEATPGHGLGLTLVRAIAIRHGMKVELVNAVPGLSVTVRGKTVTSPPVA
jgi:signal transduction histidine kinase